VEVLTKSILSTPMAKIEHGSREELPNESEKTASSTLPYLAQNKKSEKV